MEIEESTLPTKQIQGVFSKLFSKIYLIFPIHYKLMFFKDQYALLLINVILELSFNPRMFYMVHIFLLCLLFILF